MNWYFRHGTKKYKKDFTWKEMHHEYTGIILLLFGFAGIFEMWPKWVVISLISFGIWNIIDDIVQHILQRKELKKQDYYTVRTFLHWIFYPKYWKSKI